MRELDFEKIQAEIQRPQGLCLHCGRCMPIIDGENCNNKCISPNETRGPQCVWDEYPEECGYTGWLFAEREKQKHLVRKAKEEVRAMSFLPPDMIVAEQTTAQEQINKLLAQINSWNAYGAQDW